MEVFWIVVGVVAVIIYVINQNKTKISDRTVVNHNKTIKTEDGEITINRTPGDRTHLYSVSKNWR